MMHNIEHNNNRKQVYIHQIKLRVTKNEFQFLRYLMKNLKESQSKLPKYKRHASSLSKSIRTIIDRYMILVGRTHYDLDNDPSHSKLLKVAQNKRSKRETIDQRRTNFYRVIDRYNGNLGRVGGLLNQTVKRINQTRQVAPYQFTLRSQIKATAHVLAQNRKALSNLGNAIGSEYYVN